MKDLETTQTKPSITTTRICEYTSRDAEKGLSKEEVTYIGQIPTNVDLKSDEEKVWTITEFPTPHDLHNLRRFSKFDHSLTTKCVPLNRLTRKDQVFQWAEVQ